MTRIREAIKDTLPSPVLAVLRDCRTCLLDWINVRLQSASLEVTQRCNSRCLSCNTWKMQNQSLATGEEETGLELDLAEHELVVDAIHSLGCRVLELHGGEPTLCTHLVPLVAYCSELGMRTTLATNGLNMTSALAEGLVKSGLSNIRFSLDGLEKSHNYLRGREDAYEKQISAIRLVQAADEKARLTKTIRSNVSSVNLAEIDQVLDIAVSMGISKVQIAFHSVYDRSIVDEANSFFGEVVTSHRSLVPSWLLPNDIGLIKRMQRETQDKAATMGITVPRTRFFALPASEVPNGRKRERRFCSKIYHHCVIDAFGEVMPCEYIRFSLGNVRTTSLAEILDGSRFSYFEKRYSEGFQNLRLCDYCCYSL